MSEKNSNLAHDESAEMLDDEYRRMAEVETKMWWYKSLHEYILRQIHARFGGTKDIRILDAGCGTGGFLQYLRERGYNQCVGLDISSIAVERTRSNGFDVVQGSISDPGVYEGLGQFDVVVSMDVICSLPNEEHRKTFFRSAYEALNDHGIMIVQTPAFNVFRGIHDLAVGVNQRYTKSEIEKLLLQSDIKGIALSYRLFLLSPLIFLARISQRIKLKLNPQISIESDVVMPGNALNNTLLTIQRFEDRFITAKPFGTSLQIVATKGN